MPIEIAGILIDGVTVPFGSTPISQTGQEILAAPTRENRIETAAWSIANVASFGVVPLVDGWYQYSQEKATFAQAATTTTILVGPVLIGVGINAGRPPQTLGPTVVGEPVFITPEPTAYALTPSTSGPSVSVALPVAMNGITIVAPVQPIVVVPRPVLAAPPANGVPGPLVGLPGGAPPNTIPVPIVVGRLMIAFGAVMRTATQSACPELAVERAIADRLG